MALNITYLQEFIEVGLSLNLSVAAKKLHVSQPSLSKHIAALEKECGTPLLRRTASRIQLTGAGQALFEESFKLVNLHDAALERVRTLHNTPQLKIGGLYDNAAAISMTSDALATMNADTPQVTVAYQDYRHRPLAELLKEGKIDLVITILADPAEADEDFDAQFLFRDPMVCLVKHDHAFAGRENVHVMELGTQSILQPVGSYSAEHGRTTVKAIFQRYGISPNQQPVFVHTISELSTVQNEGCILIMEESMLSTQPFTDDYHVVHIAEPDVAFSFYALTHKRPNKPIAREFAKQLAESAQRLHFPTQE